MMLKNQIMKLQTYKMYEGEDTVYVERDDILKLLEQQPCEDMRDATEEERKSTKDYIDSISKPTGLQFDDIYEELDFVQPHKKTSANLQPCEDCISREAAIDTVVFECGEWTGLAKEISKQLKQLPSVTPSYNSINTELKPCEDCISREKVFYMITGGKYSDEDDEQFIDRLVNELENMPSVTPTSDAEDKYDLGYNSGYADAMSDIANEEG